MQNSGHALIIQIPTNFIMQLFEGRECSFCPLRISFCISTKNITGVIPRKITAILTDLKTASGTTSFVGTLLSLMPLEINYLQQYPPFLLIP
jgi:hypothetical protein